MLTAAKARNKRYTAEDEKVGHKNTFNLLVCDYMNAIEAEIDQVCTYTDMLVYPLRKLCNRQDIVYQIVKNLETDGFVVCAQKMYGDDDNYISGCYYELWITWRK